MLVELYMLLWITALLFTVCSFVWRGQLFFPLICFLLWNVLAVFSTSIEFIGFGSTGVLPIYSKQMGDPSWEWMTGLAWVFHGMGVAMLLFAIVDTFLVARSAVVDLDEKMKNGKPYELFERYH
jgi:hypothetical protein